MASVSSVSTSAPLKATVDPALSQTCVLGINPRRRLGGADSDDIRSRLLFKLGVAVAMKRSASGSAPENAKATGGMKKKKIQPLRCSAAATVVARPRQSSLFSEPLKFAHDPFPVVSDKSNAWIASALPPEDTAPMPRRRPRSDTIADLSMIMTPPHTEDIKDERQYSNGSNGLNINVKDYKKRGSKKVSNVSFNTTVSVAPIPSRESYSSRVRSRIWSSKSELSRQASRNIREFVSEGWNWRTCIEDEGMYICGISGERIHPVHCTTRSNVHGRPIATPLELRYRTCRKRQQQQPPCQGDAHNDRGNCNQHDWQQSMFGTLRGKLGGLAQWTTGG